MRKNMMRWRIVILICLIASIISIYARSEAADKYPSRPIEVVIGFGPGSTDVALRPFLEKLQQVLGQPINIVYKPGASGAIGASFVAKAKPDGYTLFGCSMGPIITAPLTKELDYSLDDFTPIVRTAVQPSAIVVKADARWKTLKDVIDEAKKAPGKLNFTTVAQLGTEHIPMEMLQKLGGFKLTHVPTTGTADCISAVLGGHTSMNVQNMVPLAPHLKSGALRALAIIGKERVPDFPDVPTLAELGYPIYYMGWYGIVAPKNMPKDVLQTIYSASDKVLQVYGKNIYEQQRKLLSTPAFVKGDEFGKELRMYRDMTKKALEDIK